MKHVGRESVLFFLVLLFAGCDLSSYVPEADSLRNHPSRAFIIEGEGIRGIYGNGDVDSDIYQYTTTVENADEFWEAITGNAQDADWKLAHDGGNVRHFQRITPAVREQACHSAEQVRIAYDGKTSTVTIAWIQADVSAGGAKPPTEFPTGSSSGEFANRVIWPKFEELVAGDP